MEVLILLGSWNMVLQTRYKRRTSHCSSAHLKLHALNIIQRLRRSTNMTQDQVVAQLQLMGIEISKSTYAKLETNRMNIKVSELIALRKIFDADIAEFFYGIPF